MKGNNQKRRREKKDLDKYSKRSKTSKYRSDESLDKVKRVPFVTKEEKQFCRVVERGFVDNGLYS